MVDKQFIAYCKLAHGSFNLCMFVLFCWQGWMGWRIRKARTGGGQPPLDLVRRHRTAGPVFALWGIMGFLAGVVVVVLDKGTVLEYPIHFAGGAVLASFIVMLIAVSRRITGSDPRVRDLHFRLGAVLLGLYFLQVLLGAALLL